jgi:hypothetical protein
MYKNWVRFLMEAWT